MRHLKKGHTCSLEGEAALRCTPLDFQTDGIMTSLKTAEAPILELASSGLKQVVTGKQHLENTIPALLLAAPLLTQRLGSGQDKDELPTHSPRIPLHPRLLLLCLNFCPVLLPAPAQSPYPQYGNSEHTF